MAKSEIIRDRHESLIIVKDLNGEEFLCPKSVLMKKSEVSSEDLAKCVEEWRTGGSSAIGG